MNGAVAVAPQQNSPQMGYGASYWTAPLCMSLMHDSRLFSPIQTFFVIFLVPLSAPFMLELLTHDSVTNLCLQLGFM
jgi:hypothetical protein